MYRIKITFMKSTLRSKRLHPHNLPDVVIAELGKLGLVEVDAPRRGI